MRLPSPEELADVLEVIWAIAEAHGISKKEVVRCRAERRRTTGGFDRRYILHAIIEPGMPWSVVQREDSKDRARPDLLNSTTIDPSADVP